MKKIKKPKKEMTILVSFSVDFIVKATSMKGVGNKALLLLKEHLAFLPEVKKVEWDYAEDISE